jgi:hypothetical protein
MNFTYRDTKGSNLTPAEVDANFRAIALAMGGKYYLTDYGVRTSSTPAAIAAAFQAAQNDALNSATGTGNVIIGNGIWTATVWQWNPRVAVWGQGRRGNNRAKDNNTNAFVSRSATVLRSTQTDSVFGYFDTDLVDFPATLSGFEVDGSNTAKAGLNISHTAHFDYRNIVVSNCTERGIAGDGALIGTFGNVMVENCNVGAKTTTTGLGTGALARPNLIEFIGCQWRLNKTRAYQSDGGSNVSFHSNEWGGNGAEGNLDTGCLYASGVSSEKEGVGINISGASWLEGNFGIFLHLPEQPYPAVHNLYGLTSQLGNPKHIAGYGIYVEGRNTKQIVNLWGCSINEQAGQADVYAVGANATIYNHFGIVGSVKTDEGGRYIDVASSISNSAGSGSTNPGTTPTQPANTRYKNIVAAANPAYYYYLEDASASQPAQIGSTPLQLTGSYAAQQQGPFYARDNTSLAVRLNGDALAKLAVNLSSVNTLAIECFVLTAGSSASQNGGAIFEYGQPNWGNQTGCFVFSPFMPNGELSYFGFRDNRNGGAGSNQRVPRLGSGWAHLVLVITQGTLTRYLVNGVAQTIQTLEASPSLPFANDVFTLLSGLEDASASHLALYFGADPTSVPSNSVFISHYNAAQ